MAHQWHTNGVKVCDFGLAHLKLDQGVLTSRMGSPMWTAPEVRNIRERGNIR